MKHFSFKILGIIISTLITAVAIDKMIDIIFIHYHQRSKPDLKNQNANIIFFGSSRCVHNVIPRLFDSLNSTNSFNMGWAASDPREIYAAVQLYIKFNKVPKKIILQLDLEAENTDVDQLATQSLIKYFNQGSIDDYYTADQIVKYKIPLYPSIHYRDYSWREILKSIFKNNQQTQNQGYIPIFKEFQQDNKHNKPPSVPLSFLKKQNPWIVKTIELCKKRGIQVTLFTSPYYQVLSSGRFNRFKQYNCRYFNLSTSISDSCFFSDNSHLNHLGAQLFTKLLSDSINSAQ